MTTVDHTRPAPFSGGRPRPVTVPLTVAGNSSVILTSPGRLVGWSLNASAAATVNPATAAFAGAGNGTATLAAGASITGFDVTTAEATAANTIVVTATGVAGGTLTYQLTGNGDAPQELSIRFPSALAPANIGVGIAVTVTGGTGTPAGNIVAYGSTTSTSDAIGFLYDGGQIVGSLSALAGACTEKELGPEGVYIGTSLAITVSAGEFQGCVYWLDNWHGGDN